MVMSNRLLNGEHTYKPKWRLNDPSRQHDTPQ